MHYPKFQTRSLIYPFRIATGLLEHKIILDRDDEQLITTKSGVAFALMAKIAKSCRVIFFHAHPISSFFRGFRVFGYLSDPSNYGNFPTLSPRVSQKQEREEKEEKDEDGKRGDSE